MNRAEPIGPNPTARESERRRWERECRDDDPRLRAPIDSRIHAYRQDGREALCRPGQAPDPAPGTAIDAALAAAYGGFVAGLCAVPGDDRPLALA